MLLLLLLLALLLLLLLLAPVPPVVLLPPVAPMVVFTAMFTPAVVTTVVTAVVVPRALVIPLELGRHAASRVHPAILRVEDSTPLRGWNLSWRGLRRVALGVASLVRVLRWPFLSGGHPALRGVCRVALLGLHV